MMIDQWTQAIALFFCLRFACGQQYGLNYGAGYQAYPTATSNTFELNDVMHASSSSSNFGTHRPPLSVWSGEPIIVGDYGTPTAHPTPPPATHNNVRHDYAAPPRDYARAYLPTTHQRFDQRNQDEIYPTRAVNHRYDNQGFDDEAVDNDFYNRQQLLRSSSRGRGTAQGQPSLLSSVAAFGGSENPAYTAYGRADAGSFYEPPLPLYRRQLASPAANKFAAQFAEYLRKYPQRLRPIYEAADTNGIKK